MPRPSNVKDIRSAARIHTGMALRTLAGICAQPDCPPAARVAAATALLDRGWGKPSQPVTGADEQPLMPPMSRIELAQWIGVLLTGAEQPPMLAGAVAGESTNTYERAAFEEGTGPDERAVLDESAEAQEREDTTGGEAARG